MVRHINNQTILYVDLSSREIRTEDVSRLDLEKYIGGRGINAKILYEMVKPETDPMGKENVLIFGTGVLTGTGAPSAARSFVATKSPLTGLYVKSSGGGFWGAELKRAGFDYIVLSGAAASPVFLWINDGEVNLLDAAHLWGKGTRKTDQQLKKQFSDPKLQTAVIGPAGENGVLYANIILSVNNSASRCGVGTVMGLKKLKAIAVRGTGTLEVADPERFRILADQLKKELGRDDLLKSLSRYGSAGMASDLNAMGLMPSYNFQRGQINNTDKINGRFLDEQGYFAEGITCSGCLVACRKVIKSKTHRYGEFTDASPHVEALCMLGTLCGNTDIEAILKANVMCQDLGLDLSSAGNCIAWAMESREKGVIGEAEAEADGVDLRFGNPHAVLELLDRIAYRKGWLGNLLAEGTQRAAKTIGKGSWKWAVQARGLESTMCDPRFLKGYGLGFALNPRGPDHLSAAPIAELGFTPDARKLIKRITGDEKYAEALGTEKKADIVKWHEENFCIMDALGICYVITANCTPNGLGTKTMAQLFEFATGIKTDEKAMQNTGRRIFTLERAFNVREGLRRQDDNLPWRFMNEPLADGPAKGSMISKIELEQMLTDYYRLVGWDPETGIPGKQLLNQLGLAELCANMLPA